MTRISTSVRRRLYVYAGIALAVLCGYALWEPGADIRDGRHDRSRNGLWLAHGWLGSDQWFESNGKQDQYPRYRSAGALQALVQQCNEQHVTDLFPHLCPCGIDGSLPGVDTAQVERFLDACGPNLRVIPWIGGPGPLPASYDNATWRATFCGSVKALLIAHPRLHGVQLNIEPLPSGTSAFLTLLEEMRAALPPGKLLSIAAYPPPTIWQRIPDVHWDEPFFRAVAQRVDQIAVMMYDTGLQKPKLYRKLMSDWTVEILAWSEGKPVLLGLPAYADQGVGYHHPDTENLANALAGIHAGLQRAGAPSHYQGAAIYSHWEMDDTEWQLWRERFLRTR